MGPREMRMGSGEGSIVRNFIVCTVHLIKPRRLRWAGHVARIQGGRSASKCSTGIRPGKRPLGRPRRTWEDNIGMDLKEIRVGIITRNWVDLAQDRDYWRALVNAALNIRVPQAKKLGISISLHYTVF